LADFFAVGVAVGGIVEGDAFVGAGDEDVGFEEAFVGEFDEGGKRWI
jgi:hypothetical protein